MNKKLQILLLVAFCLIAVPLVEAQTGVTGVFDNITANKRSGDLDGMRVVIFAAGDAHYAIVQIAQGGDEDPTPVLVPVTVKRNRVEFEIGGTKYRGTVSAARLIINSGGGSGETLRRKPNSQFFR